MKSKGLFAALLFPILALAAVTAIKQHRASSGVRFVFPISGYDPRDLIAGHYLRFLVDYGTTASCNFQGSGVVCLDPRVFYPDPMPHDCVIYIQGECKYGRFSAGIERFYIPQESALKLEQLIRDKKAEIEVSVTSSGRATILDLLIEGKSWKELL